MSRYYEVTGHDGPARRGKIRLGGADAGSIHTPYVIDLAALKGDRSIISMGSLLKYESLDDIKSRVLEWGDGRLCVLPYTGFRPANNANSANSAANMEMAVIEGMPEILGAVKSPIGLPMYDGAPVPQGADLYAVRENLLTTWKNPRDLVDAIVCTRETLPPDTALYAPASATPENLSILVYLGIDVVDNARAIMSAYRQKYLTADGEYYIERLDGLPCMCEACRSTGIEKLMSMEASDRIQIISEHNRNKTFEEMVKVRQLIRLGKLREYVEKQSRSHPTLTAILRFIDEEHAYLERRTPTMRKGRMLACSSESIGRVEVTRFAERVNTRLEVKSGTLLLLPCSAAKPYSTSPSHYAFRRALGKNGRKLHEAVLTSPLGVVPRELELTYPAAHYDIPTTGHWSHEEIEWVADCLIKYLKANDYERIIAHVGGAYRRICERAASELGVEMIFTAHDSGVTSISALGQLGKTAGEIDARLISKQERLRMMMRCIIDYQFGAGAGRRVIPDEAAVRGRFPRYSAYKDNLKLAAVIPYCGFIGLTLDGAERLDGFEKYWVTVGDFEPRGAILAPGVVDADLQIRPGDEVIVKGERLFGVGRAAMSGWEMVSSKRGVAVKLRSKRLIEG